MGKFQAYNIQLSALPLGSHKYEFVLDNVFFKNIDAEDVQKGNLNVELIVTRNSTNFELNFKIDGVVQVPCNRCLDDMDMEISVKDKLFVKFGKEFAEEGDNIVIVPEEEGAINVAWFLYEFIAVAVPIKHVHPAGKCNKMMSSKLRRHIARPADEVVDDEDFTEFEEDSESSNEVIETDPRWDELKKLIE
ncbi:MAG: YceD family protein [Bacteroidales bacterium]